MVSQKRFVSFHSSLYAAIIFLLIVVFPLCSKKSSGEEGDPQKATISNDFFGEREITPSFSLGKDEPSQGEYIFGHISDLAVDSLGNLYVLDRGFKRIQKFSSDLIFLKTISLPTGEGPGEFRDPLSMTIGSQGEIYICDYKLQRVTVLDSTGSFMTLFKTLYDPAMVRYSHACGSLFVIPWPYYETGKLVYKYSPVGELQAQFCQQQPEARKIGKPTGGGNGFLAVTDAGHIVFAFSFPYDIRVFSCNGELLSRFARDVPFYGEPYKEGQFLNYPGFSGGLVYLGNDIFGHVLTDRKGGKTYIDVLNVQGNYKGTLQLRHPENTPFPWVPAIVADKKGWLYVSIVDPYPKILKFPVNLFQITSAVMAK